MMDKNKFTICIRSSGEFTTERLFKDIVHQIGTNKKVHLIKNLKFHQAVDRCFEFAIEDKSEWLITLDADLVIKPDFISTFSNIANSMKLKEIEAHAMTIDRLFMNYRSAGNRLYRVSSLTLLKKLLKKTKNNIRPEGTMLREATKLGYKIKSIENVVALHDFFQFSRDLFRKGYLCSFKHISHSSELISTWRELGKRSKDFQILLRGFSFGITSKDKYTLDNGADIFKMQYKKLSQEFFDYDNSLTIPKNLNSYINRIVLKKNFYQIKPKFRNLLTNLMRQRLFEKK